MKKPVILFAALCIAITAFAQAPQSFKYQAVARNLNGSVIANQAVSFRISILRHTTTGDIVFGERHNATTNEYGLVTMDIGSGIPVVGTLASVNWANDTYFIRIEMDPTGGTSYQVMGTSQLLSVPYALHAKTVETGDNWGTQITMHDTSLDGLGTVAAPLSIAVNGVNSARIQDNTIMANDLAPNSVNGAKILDGSVTDADIAPRSIGVDKIATTGAAVNDNLMYNGTTMVWERPKGSILGTSVQNVDCACAATYNSTSYIKVSNIGTISKMESGSLLEVVFEGRIAVQTATGTGAVFELRVDDAAVTTSRARATIRSSEAGTSGIYVSITGEFPGLRNGTHTISLWVKGTSGGGTNACVDPGCFTSDHVIIREIFY